MDHSQAATQITQNFLDQLGLSDEVKVAVEFNSADQIYQITLSTQSPAVLIGYHGETLSALQLFIGFHLQAQTGQWTSVSLNVNDYRQRRETSLHSLADSTVNQVVSTGQPHILPPMPANERRIIHLHLSDHPQVTTSSQGLGRARSIVVSPR